MNTSQPTIGYKFARADGVRVIVTLEIPEDAITNINRNNVAVKEYAKHRCNKAKVLKIEDEDGKEYSSARSYCYFKKSLEYILNDTIVVDDYDMDLDEVCASGIHFFLTRRRAELFGVGSIQNGLYTSWYDNGNKNEEYTYVNGQRHGLCQAWYEYGQKYEDCTYVNGLLQGLCQKWYDNGKKYLECTYVDGQRNGLYQWWHDNGQKCVESIYLNNQLHGLYQRWGYKGDKIEECMYENGVIV